MIKTLRIQRFKLIEAMPSAGAPPRLRALRHLLTSPP